MGTFLLAANPPEIGLLQVTDFGEYFLLARIGFDVLEVVGVIRYLNHQPKPFNAGHDMKEYR